MGFPVGYSDLLFPKLLLHFVFLLGHIRWLISWIFDAVGLGDLLDSDDEPLHLMPAAAASNEHNHYHHHHHHHKFQSESAMMLIQDFLPAVRYGDLDGAAAAAGGECAVCLYEFEEREEVRRLSNCSHVFHRQCIDRWAEHEQRTCPLCRAPLFPEDKMFALQDDAFNGGVWTATGIPDYSSVVSAEDDYSSTDTSFFQSSSQPVFLPLLSAY